MVSLVQAPSWFLSGDIAVAVISAIILWVIAAKTAKYYAVSEKDKWLRTSLAFGLLALAFVGQGLLSFGLAMKPWGVASGGVVSLVTNGFLLRSAVFFWAVFLFEFMLLFGLFLFFTAYHETSKTLVGLVAFLLALVLFFAAESYYVFHLLGLILFLLITTSLIAWYRKKKGRVTRWLAFAFGVLALSRFLFILVPLAVGFYVAGSVVQVLGFLMIAWVLMVVISRGKKIAS